MSTSPDENVEPARNSYLVLMVGVLSVSTGAIFIRYAQQEVASLTIAAYSLGIAFVVVVVPTLITQRRELFALTYRDARLAAISGLFLALHFAAWIYSLELTTVAISVVFVSTTPLWVGLFSPLIVSERLSSATLLGIAVSVVGAVVIGGGMQADGGASNHFLGWLLATLGAVGLAVYLLIGQNLQQRHSLGVYVTICYGTAASYLVLAAVGAGQQFIGFTRSTWWYLIGLAIVSQVVGHSANNWALRFFSASLIAVALLGEPICSSLWAYLLFGETLTTVQIAGAALILVGIGLAARAENIRRNANCTSK